MFTPALLRAPSTGLQPLLIEPSKAMAISVRLGRASLDAGYEIVTKRRLEASSLRQRRKHSSRWAAWTITNNMVETLSYARRQLLLSDSRRCLDSTAGAGSETVPRSDSYEGSGTIDAAATTFRGAVAFWN